MKENILFSILVPVYNVESYIEECIASVLAQTYANWELILADDGSVDGSGVICDRYAASDPRIFVFHKENEGALAAREYARSKAHGEFYLFLDADDTLKKETVETVYHALLRTGSDCVIFGLEQRMDGRIIYCTPEECGYTETDKRRLYKKVFPDNRYNSLCRKAVRAELYRGEDYSRFFHISRGEDLLQSIAIYQKAESVTFLPERLYNYRINPKSVTHSVRYENYSSNFTALEMVWDFLKREGVFTEKDFADYRDCCLKLLADEAILILRFRTTLKNRLRLLKEIRQTAYYRTYLAKYKAPAADRLWFVLFMGAALVKRGMRKLARCVSGKR